ncbi:MAG: ABC transporter permease [Chloroflexota bacterium]|nr:ABC transporter permease [Dehalococcoidia bacterium]MDW8252714.1 ABC transporter permease [Chloroflexota bacterium]
MTVLTIAGKELRTYFASPLAYVVTAGFLVVTGIFFALSVILTNQASLRFALDNFRVIFLFITPLITMRLLAEEQATGTIELVLTSPVRDWELVLGKFLGALALLGVMLGLTLYYPFLLFIYGRPDPGPIISGYLGLILLGAGFIAIGLFTSALTKNQIIAAVLAFALLLVFWLAAPIGDVFQGVVRDVLRYLSAIDHYTDFSRGVIDTKDIVYYLSLTAAALFATVQVVGARRWI